MYSQATCKSIGSILLEKEVSAWSGSKKPCFAMVAGLKSLYRPSSRMDGITAARTALEVIGASATKAWTPTSGGEKMIKTVYLQAPA
jgi:hypothetical protein